MKTNKPVCFAALLVIFLVCSKQAKSQEVEDEREFNYIRGSGVGPEHWGELHEEWAACGNGSLQSPIDLLDERVEVLHHLGRLNRSYKPSNASVVNRGHDIMLRWPEGAGQIYINGTAYTLRQCHHHSPSEHTVNGQRYALEVHMVHESADGKTAVVSIMYKIGRPDSFLSELMESIRNIANTNEGEEVVGIVDPRHIKIGSRKYYRYTGSLTTPPCTEGVVWTMVKKVRTVSREQVRLLRDAVHDDSEMNARPTQATNERDIHLFVPRKLRS